ncbi:MAG: hypothetical protein DRP01_11455 [Archaeoglobales archaeon]|nr:MAG: hypothetical protein DRP01_11455 [Archaeoglobales archaeon]
MEIFPGITLDAMEAEIPIVELKPKKGCPYGEVVFMGDFHVGSGHFSEKQYLEYVKWIKENPTVKVVLMGDYVEMGSLSRYGASEKQLASIQLMEIVRLLRPIKNRIIVFLEGNHEERFWRATKGTESLTEIIAAKLGINPLMPGPERGQLFVIRIKYKNFVQNYPVYAIHGATSAVIRKETQLKKIFENLRASLIAHAHIHQIFKDHKTYYAVRKLNDKFYLTCHEQHWLTTGCFVKNLGYAEKKSLPITKIGAPIVRFYYDKEGIEIIDDPRITYNIGIKTDTKAGGLSLQELRRITGVGEPKYDLDKIVREFGRRVKWKERDLSSK